MYKLDPLPSGILEVLDKNASKYLLITLAKCSQDLGLLFYKNWLYIPDSNDSKATLL